MPREITSTQINSLGVGEGFSEDEYVDRASGTESPFRERYFDTTYNVVITSDNHREVLIIYHVIKSIFISALSEVDLAGLENPSVGGQDITIPTEIVPEHLFARGFMISSTYKVQVPRFFSQDTINRIIVGSGTIITS